MSRPKHEPYMYGELNGISLPRITDLHFRPTGNGSEIHTFRVFDPPAQFEESIKLGERCQLKLRDHSIAGKLRSFSGDRRKGFEITIEDEIAD